MRSCAKKQNFFQHKPKLHLQVESAFEKENAELKKMLAESMLENRVLKEVNAKKW